MKKIAIIQPAVPTYREQFFKELQKFCELDVYIYKDCRKVTVNIGNYYVHKLSCLSICGFDIFNILPVLRGNYDAIVLPLQFSHPASLLVLLFKWLFRKKIIVWGQGISVKRYLKEEHKEDFRLKWMISRADGAWIYMRKECEQWKSIFPQKPLVALDNTISDISSIVNYDVNVQKESLKKKYNIIQEQILIFCARFDSPYRRVDLLVDVIKTLDPHRFGFIIIGAGKNKPDFSAYDNVYEFGAVYEQKKKNELFSIADIYFQPGWVGLSIVEAMAYGKPICTFKRSTETLQCVEYGYIKDGNNGYVFEDLSDCIDKLVNTSPEQFRQFGNNSRHFVAEKLSPRNMAANAFSILEEIL